MTLKIITVREINQAKKFTKHMDLFVKISNKFIVAESRSVVNWREGSGWHMAGKGRKGCLHCRIRRILVCYSLDCDNDLMSIVNVKHSKLFTLNMFSLL